MHTAQNFSSAQHNRMHQGCQTGAPRAKSDPPCPVLWPTSCRFRAGIRFDRDTFIAMS